MICCLMHVCRVTCCVVARQYSAVLRMLQMRHSSSIVNLATSPSFSFSRLLMVRPPLLVLVLHANEHKHGYQRTLT